MNQVIKIIFDDDESESTVKYAARYIRLFLEDEDIIASMQVSEEEYEDGEEQRQEESE